MEEIGARVRVYNGRRDRFLRTLDLAPLNGQIKAYHRYYLIEREAWCRSGKGASSLKRPKPVTLRDLESRLPRLRWP
jgi:hypothetical protein